MTSSEILTAIVYNAQKLMQYEWCNRADDAKKVLEQHQISTLLRNNEFKNTNKLRSLDIGSATGRYPLWFSERGFYAIGYDISEEAVRMARRSAEGRSHIEFHVRNVLEMSPELELFTIITCMMGTFNHIPHQQHSQLMDWAYQSLQPHGIFTISVWNADCPYTTYLQLYTREEKELIKQNAIKPETMATLAQNAGFTVERITPICFLPDECYNAWMGRLDTASLCDLDDYLAAKLRPNDAQMFVTVLRKSAKPPEQYQ